MEDEHTIYYAPLLPYVRLGHKVFVVQECPKKLGEYTISFLPVHNIFYVISATPNLHVPRIGFMPDEHRHFSVSLQDLFATKDQARGYIKAQRYKLVRERESKIKKIRREIDHLHRLQEE